MKDNEIDRILEKLNTQDIERRTKYVIAQKQMVEHELKANYMIRQEPSDPWDSGWRFFHGNETAEMIERSDEFFDCYNPSEILYKGNEAIKKYLDAPFGSRFVRENDDFISENDSESEEPNQQEVIDLQTKDLSELKELLSENYDLKPNTDLSREEYIETVSSKVLCSPQLLYDEMIDLLHDNIAKGKELKEAAERKRIEDIERQKEERKEEISLACFILLLMTPAIYNTILLFSGFFSKYFNNGRSLYDSLLRVSLTMLDIVCIFGTCYFLFHKPTDGKRRKSYIIKGILLGLLTILSIVYGKII